MLILVAHIVSAHGIKGLVHVRSFTHQPQDFILYGPLCDHSGTVYQLKIVRFVPKGMIICSVQGINDRNQAEALKGTELFADRSNMPELETNTYYHSDLVGMNVVDSSGAQLGIIKAVYNYGAGDFFDVECPDQTIATLPFLDEYAVNIDQKQLIAHKDHLIH